MCPAPCRDLLTQIRAHTLTARASQAREHVPTQLPGLGDVELGTQAKASYMAGPLGSPGQAKGPSQGGKLDGQALQPGKASLLLGLHLPYSGKQVKCHGGAMACADPAATLPGPRGTCCLCRGFCVQ